MNIVKNTFSVSPLRFTSVFMGMAAVWLFAPEIVHAAVTFGEMGENVADNAKGVAKKASHLPDTLPERVWAYGALWICIRPRKIRDKALTRAV